MEANAKAESSVLKDTIKVTMAEVACVESESGRPSGADYEGLILHSSIDDDDDSLESSQTLKRA